MGEPRIGFIGAGKMATALANGFHQAGLVAADAIWASDPAEPARRHFAQTTGGTAVAENAEVAGQCQVLFLAVKPQHMQPVLAELARQISREHLVVSIAAGVKLNTLHSGLGDGPRLVRVMPNTPALVQAGASAYALGPGATEQDAQLVGRLLDCVGRSYQVDESLLDAVTGLSGSGPAFVYAVIEALSDGGVLMGLPRQIATELAAQTVYGAAHMVLTTGEHPATLRDQVTSPGGTTIAGIAALEQAGLRAALIEAVQAATERSRELGQS